ncbi:protein disulfide-isomerase c17h9.14c [Anaeramoeba ignava]|uniref:Protein disulfide-isomerase c17h9.14c n=1 Tax=Anaeramoeba ignava TaxID=1746090 RepID=A0A9Q0R7R9_ANAIG|nr:protein disulfide-isomerase c17h9.14c [Anaeramoeba ignava]
MTKDNYQEILSDLDSCLVIKYYTTYCGACKSFKFTYEKLAEHFENNEKIKFLEVECDGKGKEVCIKAKLKGYPTIHLFGKNKEFPIQFESARLLSKLIDFVDSSCFDEETENEPISFQKRQIEKPLTRKEKLQTMLNPMSKKIFGKKKEL